MSFIVPDESGLCGFAVRESMRIDKLLINLRITKDDKIDLLVSLLRQIRPTGDRDYDLGQFSRKRTWLGGYRVWKIQTGSVILTRDKTDLQWTVVYCPYIVDIQRST
jgi:hypothetical protein